MTFAPEAFLQTAQAVLKSASSEADLRTIAGRAYYATYGFMREHVCAAKGTPPRQMFGSSGRHTEVAELVTLIAPFKLVGGQYNGLLTLRVQSDYKYHVPLTKADADGAVRDAEWVLGKLRGFDEKDFKGFPLNPPKKPRSKKTSP